jgi:hypothetical protein
MEKRGKGLCTSGMKFRRTCYYFWYPPTSFCSSDGFVGLAKECREEAGEDPKDQDRTIFYSQVDEFFLFGDFGRSYRPSIIINR